MDGNRVNQAVVGRDEHPLYFVLWNSPKPVT